MLVGERWVLQRLFDPLNALKFLTDITPGLGSSRHKKRPRMRSLIFGSPFRRKMQL